MAGGAETSNIAAPTAIARDLATSKTLVEKCTESFEILRIDTVSRVTLSEFSTCYTQDCGEADLQEFGHA